MKTPVYYAEQLRQRFSLRPTTAIVLGSGFAPFGEELENREVVPFAELEEFPRSTAPGHPGRFLAGTVKGVPVLCLQGRLHYYEGYTMEQVVLPIRVMQAFGIRQVILTNAAGAINLEFHAGEVMLITDHINLMGTNPLIGPNDNALGERFPDMTQAYSPRLQQLARSCAQRLHLPLREGVYLGCTGPSFETPAEIRAFRTLGADAVAMSLVPETIAAVHCGVEVLGLSLLSNLAAGVSGQPLSGEEVNQAAEQSRPMLTRFLKELLSEMGTQA